MCGEMIGEATLAILLLGLGLDEFSMPFFLIPKIKQLIRSIYFKEAEELAKKALDLPTSKAVEDFMSETLKKNAPDIYDNLRNGTNNQNSK